MPQEEAIDATAARVVALIPTGSPREFATAAEDLLDLVPEGTGKSALVKVIVAKVQQIFSPAHGREILASAVGGGIANETYGDPIQL